MLTLSNCKIKYEAFGFASIAEDSFAVGNRQELQQDARKKVQKIDVQLLSNGRPSLSW